METNNQKGLDFEKKCYEKLRQMGFSGLSYTANNDNGADIIGTHSGITYVFQCKCHEKRQGNRCVQEIIAARRVYKANRCVVISKSEFTASAIELAKVNICILITSSEFFALDSFPPKEYAELQQGEYLVHDIDYDVLAKYEEIRNLLKRTPKWDELDKHLRYRIKKEYKNYGSFLMEIGESKYSHKHSDDEIRKEYLRVRMIIGRIPTLSDIEEHSAFPRNSFSSYPFTKLQMELGDRPNIVRGVTKEQLIDEYFCLEKKLGHPPSINEIDALCRYRSSYYRRRWGSMNAFLESIGKTRSMAGLPRVYTNKEIICIYSLIKVLISVVEENADYEINYTIFEQLKLHDKQLISPTTISKRFGGWNKFKQYLRDEGIEDSLKEIIEQLKDNDFEVFSSSICELK